MSCDARIRPMVPVNDTEIVCLVDGEHARHEGELRDYAWPGSLTVVVWFEDDRRTFHGVWPGGCPDCNLPLRHRGGHAS